MKSTGLPVPLLFMLPALIWGSTFFVIKFQLGMVPPIWSVAYRFFLGGLMLLIFCYLRKFTLSFSLREHLRMMLQGILLFGLNYWLVYLAEQELISALVAIAFSTIIFFNIIFGSIFMGNRTAEKVFIGAAMGLFGTVLLFYQELGTLTLEELPVLATVQCALSVVVASLGNITSAVNQRHKIPVMQANGFGMIYGALGMGLIALTTEGLPVLDLSMSYLGSLLYLTVFGSIVAFGAYLTLIGTIGPDRAAYVLVMIPVTALFLSVVFEGYNWNFGAFLGIVLILSGNVLVLRKTKTT